MHPAQRGQQADNAHSSQPTVNMQLLGADGRPITSFLPEGAIDESAALPDGEFDVLMEPEQKAKPSKLIGLDTQEKEEKELRPEPPRPQSKKLSASSLSLEPKTFASAGGGKLLLTGASAPKENKAEENLPEFRVKPEDVLNDLKSGKTKWSVGEQDEFDKDGAGEAPKYNEEIPDWDGIDRLAAPPQDYEFAAASCNPKEMVWGAMAPESAEHIDWWTWYLQSKDISRVVALLSEFEIFARSSDGTVDGYIDALVEGGFEREKVTVLDPTASGTREALQKLMDEAVNAKEKLCINCPDGMTGTGVALADYMISTTGEAGDPEEAVALLKARKRMSGVDRKVKVADLEAWLRDGHL
jgi:hypothetical protein